MTGRQALWTVFWSLILFSGAAFLYRHRDHYKWPPVEPTIPPITATITPPFDMGFEAVTRVNTQCFDWSYQVLTEIESNDQVNVLGRNKDASWYMVRWPRLATACWAMAEMLKPSNFSPDELFVISAPFPPAFTGTPTFATSITALTTGTTHILTRLTPTQTRRPPGDRTPTPRVTPDPTDPLHTRTPFTPGPTDPATKTPVTPDPIDPPTRTPVTPESTQPTIPTPDGPRECNDGSDNDGDGKTDFPADPGCRNRGDDSE